MTERLTFAELTDEQREIAKVGVRRMAEQGHELTPDQFVDAYSEVHQKILRLMGGQYTPDEYIRLFALSRLYDENGKLPPPPYGGLFDDEAEARSFAERAAGQHNVKLLVQHSTKRNRWRVVEAEA